ASPLGDVAGHHLVAKLLQNLDTRPDKDQPGFLTGTSEVGVLGEKTVSGMDGIDLVLPCHGDDAGNVEIGSNRLAGLTARVRLVRFEAMQGETVFMRVNRHGADA